MTNYVSFGCWVAQWEINIAGISPGPDSLHSTLPVWDNHRHIPASQPPHQHALRHESSALSLSVWLMWAIVTIIVTSQPLHALRHKSSECLRCEQLFCVPDVRCPVSPSQERWYVRHVTETREVSRVSVTREVTRTRGDYSQNLANYHSHKTGY